MAVLVVLFWVGGLAAAVVPLAAATAELRLLLDLDSKPSTGCGVATADGTFLGVEQILLTTVETTETTAAVIAVERQVCTNPGSGTFGPRLAVELSGWPVGIANGLNATHVVETFFPLSAAGFEPTAVRLGLLGVPGGRTQDALIVTQPGGETDIILDLGRLDEIEIPTLSEWGLLLLALLLATVALAVLRRRTAAILLGVVLLGASATVWAVCVLDGETDDWVGTDLLAEDDLADGPAGADLRALFGKRDSSDLCFRFDTGLVFEVAAPNQAPVVDPATFGVAEHSPPGTSVGAATFSDPDSGQSHTFAITNGNTGGAFAIDTSTGEITVANSTVVDFETHPSFLLTVEVTDDGVPSLTGTATITLNLTDINEPPVANDATFSVAEDSANGTGVGTVTFTDSDAGQTHALAIAAGNIGGAFTIDASTGQITVADGTALDFETIPSFSLTVEVTDDGTPPLSGSATISVNLGNVNEPPVANDASFSVDENSTNGTDVGTVTFTDPDAGQTHTFAITAGNTGGAFAIDASTGQVTVADGTALDFETTPSFSLTVEVTDSGTPPLSDTATVGITIKDLNESPAVNDAMFSVAENSANGTSVGSVTFTDPDTGQTYTFAITSGNIGGAFAINASTGEITVANAAALDFETSPSFSLTVEVTDDGTPPLTGSATVTITVTDQNEAPSVNPATFSVDENSANATNVGTVTFTDPDAGQTHTFAITAGNAGGAFAIDASTGQITVADGTALDFETNPSFSLTVEVTDSGASPLSDASTVGITVNDLNESPAVNDAMFTVVENSSDGTSVVTVSFSDPDAGQSHTFAITAGNTGSAFAIDTSTGEITVASSAALDFETNPSFSLTVEVTDDGAPPLAGTATVTGNLTDVNEPPDAVDDPGIATDEDTPITILVLANDTDPDAGNTLTIVAVSGATGTVINNGTDLSYDPTTAFNSLPQGGMAVDSFTYTIQDSGGLQDTATVTVTIGGLNDDPIADDETYSAIGNTQLAVAKSGPFGVPTFSSTLADVLDGDVDPDTGDTLSAVVFSGALPSGATLVLAADGSFFYTPPPGQATSDSFDYTVQDSFGGTDLGTVTINVAKMVWYVDNTANGGVVNTGSGTSTDPFSTLSDGAGNVAPDDAEDASAAGDILYVLQGSGTTNQDQGISLENQQKLLGEGVSLVIDPDDGGPEPAATLFVGNPAKRPHVTRTGAGDAVSVLANTANGDRLAIEIRGLQLSSASGNAIDVTSADAANLGVTISENAVSGAGLEGIDVNAGSTSTTQTLSVDNNSLLATGTALDVLRSAGTLTITAFDDNTVSGNTVGSGLVVNGAVFDAVPGLPIQTVAGGVTAIGQSGNGVGAHGLLLANVIGDLAFTDLDIWNDAGTGLRVTSTGVLNAGAGTGFRITVPAAVASIDSNGGPAVDIDGASITLPLGFLESTGSPSTGISLVSAFGGTGATALSASSGQITDPGGVSGAAVNVSGGNGNVSLGIPITNTSGNAVSISSRSGDTVAFMGAITETGSGISLTSNTGATISFRGGLAASTGSNPAFTASGGGNIEVCDDNPCNPGGAGPLVNTLATTTATALQVANTTITGNHLEFRSVSSNGGGNPGIILTNTCGGGPVVCNTAGGAGGLKVRGSGGSCTSAATCTGGAIQNKTVDGVSLNNTRSTLLANLWIDNNDGSGVFGDDLTDFSLVDSQVTNSGDTPGGTEAGLRFQELLGTCAITNSTIAGSVEDNIRMTPASGILSGLTISGSTIGPNNPTTGGNGLAIVSSGTAEVSVSLVASSMVRNNRASGVLTTIGGTSLNLLVDASTIQDNNVGIDLGNGVSSDVTATLSNNILLRHTGSAINLVTDAGNNNSAQYRVTVDNNQIGNGTVDSGSVNAFGIAGDFRGDVDAIVSITNNTIRNTDIEGIFVQSRLDDADADAEIGHLDLTLRDNTVFAPDDNSAFPFLTVYGTRIESRNTTNLCLDIAGNSSEGIGGFEDFRTRQRDTSTFRVERLALGAQTAATMQTFVVGQNDAGSTASATAATSYTGVADGTCRKP